MAIQLSEEFLLRFYVLHKKHKKICLKGTSNNQILIAERYWVMLAIEYILHPRDCRSDYPFVLPYLEIFNRLVEVKNMLRKIVKQKLECTLMKILAESREVDSDFVAIAEKICNNCQEHMEELFVEVKDKNGKEVKIVRHNGIEELNHRWSRMHIRRRTGRSRTSREMSMYGALLAVFSNIECKDYIETVFADVKDFVRDIQDVTEKEIMEAKRLIRKLPQRPLVKSDADRPMILREFIRMIDELDDIPIMNVEKWLTHFKTEALLTP